MQHTIFSIGRLINGQYLAAGTCTLINRKNTLVTAAHVVNGNDTNLVIKLNDNFVNGYQDTTLVRSEFYPVNIEKIDPLRDVCILSLKGNVDVRSNLNIGNSDNVNPGEEVTIFGFPHSDLGRIVLTQQSCAIGAKILLSSKTIKSKHLVLNIQARPGQSGGPIIRKSDNTIIALLIGAYVPTIEAGITIGGIDPQTLHQTTHAVSTEYIERML
ncbi:serine protease [Bacillus cereus]|uniref:S1 family peptidase n=1 Tax=Bacillus TaxID=1386 RepID=UPI0009359D77|nr:MULTISPECIES: serine protease [Bacillus cereus group]PFN32017.1 serine protease [Bacillus cereus]MCU5208573.1 serine protease [Bacillus paranthracis]MDA2160896.1 serine protease [Bacillus cereus group sp. Bc252]MDF9512456.1 serine protease [Bacillus paranthracis]MDF9670519.1 serine protease [Bacillus paranthracis]